MENLETKIKKNILYQESDYCGHYRLSEMFSILSDLATKNATEIGIWKEEFEGIYGWVLVKQTLKLQRPIKIGEAIYLSTRAGKSSKIQFVRQYDIQDNNDHFIGGVYSVWTLLDLHQRRIVRPDKVGMDIPGIKHYEHYVSSYQEVDTAIDVSFVMERKVVYSDLDVNQHMNNYRYIEWALDVFDYTAFKEYFITELSMVYKKELAPNTNVKILFGQKDNAFKVVFVSEDEQTIHFELSGLLSKI